MEESDGVRRGKAAFCETLFEMSIPDRLPAGISCSTYRRSPEAWEVNIEDQKRIPRGSMTMAFEPSGSLKIPDPLQGKGLTPEYRAAACAFLMDLPKRKKTISSPTSVV